MSEVAAAIREWRGYVRSLRSVMLSTTIYSNDLKYRSLNAHLFSVVWTSCRSSYERRLSQNFSFFFDMVWIPSYFLHVIDASFFTVELLFPQIIYIGLLQLIKQINLAENSMFILFVMVAIAASRPIAQLPICSVTGSESFKCADLTRWSLMTHNDHSRITSFDAPLAVRSAPMFVYVHISLRLVCSLFCFPHLVWAITELRSLMRYSWSVYVMICSQDRITIVLSECSL